MASLDDTSFTKTYHHDVYPAIDPTQPALDCSGKIVLITGGGRGIGKAISIAFAKAHAGGIVLLGRTQATLEETAAEIKAVTGGKTIVLVRTADVANSASVRAAFDAAIEHFGSKVPDIVVHNAGGVSGLRFLTEEDPEDFWKTYELNVRGTFNVIQAHLQTNAVHSADTPRMFINISSSAGIVPFVPGFGGYSTSKMAGAKLVEQLHYENPAWSVFNVHPGVIDTDLSQQGNLVGQDTPQLPAAFAVWLSAHPEAVSFNGRFLWANWDVNEMLARKNEISQRNLLTMSLKGWAEDMTMDEYMKILMSLASQ